jgi:GTP-binding protein HflX
LIDENEFQIPPHSKATLVSIVSRRMPGHENEADTDRSLLELRELMRTLDIPVDGEIVQKKNDIDPATVIGRGKLEEIGETAKAAGSNILVFDFELTASQARNIKEITGIEAIDRCNVILEIFAKHAHTKEAKIQIEISRLQYLLPRLSSLWTHFSRQKGGIGMKGEGEQQLELDRRIVREKIEHYKELLKGIETSREEQRKRRKHKAVTAALVGYTNAGKSSLMNRLCKVEVLEENKLFATLDSTFRMLNPDTKPPMILIDTVGFISNLPNTLIEGFRTTLESAMEAELIIQVIDLADPHFENHIKVTNDVLKELGVIDKKTIYVFNKKDLVADLKQKSIYLHKYNPKFVVSSFNAEDMDSLRQSIIDHFLAQQTPLDIFVPYEDGQTHSIVMGKTNVLITRNHETGIYYRIRVPEFILNSLDLKRFQIGPTESKIFE